MDCQYVKSDCLLGIYINEKSLDSDFLSICIISGMAIVKFVPLVPLMAEVAETHIYK